MMMQCTESIQRSSAATASSLACIMSVSSWWRQYRRWWLHRRSPTATAAAATAAAVGATSVLEVMHATQLPPGVNGQLDTVGTLVVHTATAHRLAEVLQHRPRRARQVAQVALLPVHSVVRNINRR